MTQTKFKQTLWRHFLLIDNNCFAEFNLQTFAILSPQHRYSHNMVGYWRKTSSDDALNPLLVKGANWYSNALCCLLNWLWAVLYISNNYHVMWMLAWILHHIKYYSTVFYQMCSLFQQASLRANELQTSMHWYMSITRWSDALQFNSPCLVRFGNSLFCLQNNYRINTEILVSG